MTSGGKGTDWLIEKQQGQKNERLHTVYNLHTLHTQSHTPHNHTPTEQVCILHTRTYTRNTLEES